MEEDDGGGATPDLMEEDGGSGATPDLRLEAYMW